MVRVNKKKTAGSQVKHKKVLRDTIRPAMKDPQISRIATRAGVVRHGAIYELTRGWVKTLLQRIIGAAFHVSRNMKRKTISGNDVDTALSLHGLTNVNGTRKGKAAFEKYSAPKGGARKKKNAIAKAEAGETFIFDREPFKAFCKEISQEYDDDVLFSSDSHDILQILVESQLDKVFRSAERILENKNRATLDYKTALLAFNLSEELSVVPLADTDVDIPQEHIKIVLRQNHPDTGATHQAVEEMSSMINYAAGKIIAVVNALLLSSGRKTVSSRDILTGIRIAIPGMLGKQAVSQGSKSATMFRVSKLDSGGTKASLTPQSGQSRAGLTFSVSRTKNAIRTSSVVGRVGSGAGPYLAGALEIISGTIWDTAGTISIDKKKVRITPLHLRLAVRDDDELSMLFSSALMSVVNDINEDK